MVKKQIFTKAEEKAIKERYAKFERDYIKLCKELEREVYGEEETDYSFMSYKEIVSYYKELMRIDKELNK